ncbi:hypothetical protein GQ43DRAFT_351959, partial [Delitschia confertaspora ATCC 74209]
MSARYRTSTAQSTPGRASMASTSGSGQLPPYEKPAHPLNQKAQSQLNSTYHHMTNRSRVLKEKHIMIGTLIAETAGKLNEDLIEREHQVKRRRIRLAKQGLEPQDDDPEEQAFEQFKEEVNEMTKNLEKGMRDVIDGEINVDRTEEALRWLKENASAHAAREYETQMSQHQTQTQQRRRRNQGEDEVEDEGSSPGPTPLGAEGIALTGPIELFQNRLKDQKEQYLALPLAIRYSKNNAYIQFKRSVHDGLHGDDGVPLPRSETWFSSRGSPAPGITASQFHNNDSDDDIAIERETVSTRCPITLQEFKDPVTSVKCPHSFEKAAILQMIAQSVVRSGERRGGRGEKVVQCPVSGCEQMLSTQDVRPDLVLVRKIQRIQKANQREYSDEEND